MPHSSFFPVRNTVALVLTVVFATLHSVASAQESKFKLDNGDRVVFLGDGLIEQEQYAGWIEVMLTTSFSEADVTFRNLGWNADTPTGKSRCGLSDVRAGEEKDDDGWKQLVKQLEQTNPTVVILGYGLANSLEESDPANFIRDYERLSMHLRSQNEKVRFVFLSMLPPHGKSRITSETAQRYNKSIEGLASKLKASYVDLSNVALASEFRHDPIHVNDSGYKQVAIAIHSELKLPESQWQSSEQTESLRQMILRKNRWWFHRSRPANMAYVFGFRKHEQGQNAGEIPEFDLLIATEESVIAQLRSLRGTRTNIESPRTESAFAEFVAQPQPKFTVADGLEVTLWAENPMLNKPTQINFDPAGRMWVASSETYPMIEVGQAEADKIVVLEDSNGDGKADKSTVFADGLLIPTGVIPGDGGVYVAQSTDLLFLKDTDGDGKADFKRRVLSGFGTEDTHHNLHTLVWGPDGRLYMNQSVYTRTNTETPHGVVRHVAGGGFRLSTKTLRMQPFFHGLWNSWGHQFDRNGQSFMTDGAGFDGLAYIFPGATINPTPSAPHLLDLISAGKYPKLCAAEIIQGDSFPSEWQGSLVTCDFRANRVTRFKLLENGAGFASEQTDDLIRTSESSFRPIDVKQGPDGALYVADWSNPIINHGEVDFRDPRRDRWHGRIWRISAKDKPEQKPVNLFEASTQTLLGNLLSNDRYQVDQSRRVLIERGDESESAIPEWIKAQKNDAARLQGLWLCQALGIRDLSLLGQLLSSKTPEIRAASVRVLSDWSDPETDLVEPIPGDRILEWFEGLINDPHPRVRLETIRAISSTGHPDAIAILLQAINHPVDRFVKHALQLAVIENSTELIARLEKPEWLATDSDRRQKQLEFVLSTVAPENASRFLTSYLANNDIAENGQGPWIELIGRSGDKAELLKLYRSVVQGNFNANAKCRALKALAYAQSKRHLRPDRLESLDSELGPLLDSSDTNVVLSALELTGAWKVKQAVSRVAKTANNELLPEPLRLAAVRTLGEVGDESALDALKTLSSSGTEMSLRIVATSSLARQDIGLAMPSFFATLADTTNETEALQLWRAMLSKKGAAPKIAAALQDKLPKWAALAGIRVGQEGGRSAPELVGALLPMAGMSMTAAEWTPDKIVQFTKAVATEGDPSRGELIYRTEALQCIKCHAIGGVGGKVGPDMTSLGASAPADYIIESMFDPNSKIKENYHSVIVMTVDGEIISGIEAGSTPEELVLRDAEGKTIRIPVDDVEEKKDGKSLMPAGLLDRISQKDQVDLISFLVQLGKPGKFDASRQNVARRLEIFPGTHQTEQDGNQKLIAGDEVKGWKSLQTFVNGSIKKQALDQLTTQPINVALVGVYLRTYVESNGGTAKFSISGLSNAEMWIDGKPIERAELSGESETAAQDSSVDFQVDLVAGRHTALLRLDAREIPESLFIRSNDVTFVGE